MASRRLFLGSIAAAGIGGVGISAFDFGQALAQPKGNPLTGEIRKQLKGSLQKLQFGSAADGAKQAATIMRIYAATVDDNQLRQLLRKANRQKLLVTEMGHVEMERAADELGVQRYILNQGMPAGPGREVVLNRLLKEGLSPMLRRLADDLDKLAPVFETQVGKTRAITFQPIPDCGDCNWVCGQVQAANDAATVICAAAVIFPPMAELCGAALAAYLTWVTSCAVCGVYLKLCGG